MLCRRTSQTMFSCATTVLTRKDLTVSLTKDSALPGEQSANYVRSNLTFKIPRNANDYNKKEKQNQQIKTIKKQQKLF